MIIAVAQASISSSSYVQAALDQSACRKGIFSNFNIVFLIVKAQKQKKFVKMHNLKPTTLHFFCYGVG